MKLFDLINSLSDSKKNYFEEDKELASKVYTPFVVNKYFSFFIDTIIHSNIMNMYSFLDKDIQHDYYYHGIRKKKRYTKWLKQEECENSELISKHFSVSRKRATEMLELLSPEYVDELKSIYSMGINQVSSEKTKNHTY